MHMMVRVKGEGEGKALAGQRAVYQTFTVNHFSYTKTLIQMYRFRAIIFSILYGTAILGGNDLFANKLKYIVMNCFFKKLSLLLLYF